MGKKRWRYKLTMHQVQVSWFKVARLGPTQGPLTSPACLYKQAVEA